MDVYLSEDEQIDAIKKWWKENGTAIITGLVLGIGALSGWKYWQARERAIAENASAGYQEMLELLDENKPQEAVSAAGQLTDRYERSGYRIMAEFALARLAVETGDFESAKSHLRYVAEKADRPELRYLARLRLARLLLSDGEPDAALALLDKVAAQPLRTASYHELRGDVLLAQGKRDAARAEYSEALNVMQAEKADTSLLQLKIDDLGTPAQSIAAK